MDVKDHSCVPRLGKCELCDKGEAKYTCPRCAAKTCCLSCVNNHKSMTGCSGVRNKTAYIPLNEFSDLDLLSDYRLLEEVGRSTDAYSRDPLKRSTQANKVLPWNLDRLRAAASKQGVQLRFLPANFSRHKLNSTFLDRATQKIEWRVEWKFTWLNHKVADDRVDEDLLLPPLIKNQLEAAHATSTNFEDIKVFLAAEHVPGQSGRYYKMDLSKSLSENLKGKTIIEYPILQVVIGDTENYPLVGTEDQRVVKKAIKNEEPCSKKGKLTFYEISDGELCDSDSS